MKKPIIALICFLATCNLPAQNDIKENSIGISVQPINISEIYDLGIGFYFSQDFSKSGKGFGYILNGSYLIPNENYSDLIMETYEAELALKYDIRLTDFLEIYPLFGGGGISTKFTSEDSDTEFYIVAGGGVTLSLSKTIRLGVDIFKPFLDYEVVVVTTNIRFNVF